MTTIIRNGQQVPVKNLGWLLRHWKDVNHFLVHETGNGSGYMLAVMRPGNKVGWFGTDWASLSICRDWLDRPVFRGVPVDFLGELTTCGNITWRAPWEGN